MILVLILSIHIANAMLASNICSWAASNFTKFDGSLNLPCTSNLYPYKCGNNDCAKSIHKCHEYLELTRFLDSKVHKTLKANLHLIGLPRKIE